MPIIIEDTADFDARLALGLMTWFAKSDWDFAYGRAQQIREFFILGAAGDNAEYEYQKKIRHWIIEKHPEFMEDESWQRIMAEYEQT